MVRGADEFTERAVVCEFHGAVAAGLARGSEVAREEPVWRKAIATFIPCVTKHYPLDVLLLFISSVRKFHLNIIHRLKPVPPHADRF